MATVASLGNLDKIGKRIVSGTLLEIVTLDNIDTISIALAKCVGIYETYKTVVDDLTRGEMKRIKYTGGERYHGVHHAMLVFIAAMEGIYHQPIAYDKDIKNLAIAALMHDYGHVAMGIDDDVNIDAALHGVSWDIIKDREDVSLMSIRGLIKASRFPWKTKNPVLMAKILRDSDLMFAYLKDAKLKHKFIRVLFSEMNGGLHYNEATPEQLDAFYKGQAKFHTIFSWNTRWGAMKAVKYNYPMLLLR